VVKPAQARIACAAAAFWAVTICAALPCFGTTPAPDERITQFTADLTLRKDTSMEVREDFLVHSEETYFKQGLVRFLPVNSEARWDKRFGGDGTYDTKIRVTILEVTEDGQSISYDQGSVDAYAQLRIGQFNVPLSRGDHRIVIRYLVEGALRKAGNLELMYWNVLGHNWQLPVDAVDVRVQFPEDLPVALVSHSSYAGARGFTKFRNPELPVTSEITADALTYQAGHFGPAQSLSISFSFPEKYVNRPIGSIFARDAFLFGGPVLVCLYYLIVWLRLGPEPILGSVPVRYEAPAGLSPGAVRYIRTSGCDSRTLAAVIAQLAVRGCIHMEPENGQYKLTRGTNDPAVVKSLAPEEYSLLGMLFEDGPEAVVRPSNSRNLNAYQLAIAGQLRTQFDGKYSTGNYGKVALGYLGAFALAQGMALISSRGNTFPLFFLTFWFFFCASMLGGMALAYMIPAVFRLLRGMGGLREVLPGVFVIAIFGSLFVYLLKMFAKNISPTYSLALGLLVAVNLVWAPALKRLTPEGRQAMRDIEGFRLFLEKVQQDQMQRLNAKGDSPDGATASVPYAIALEVKEAWGDHLSALCFAMMTNEERR
jgi:Predicted membrane protein (DUF2207)